MFKSGNYGDQGAAKKMRENRLSFLDAKVRRGFAER
jgi:hypothetical protein